jgi:hypothetical protein
MSTLAELKEKIIKNPYNKEIVLSVVKKYGLTLCNASDRLKDDEEVVMAAVSQNGFALKYASERLRSDVNFCIECANIDSDCTLFFKGEAKEIFQAHHNDIVAIEQQQQQNKANEALLAKLSTCEIVVPNHLFKRKLFNV